MSPENNGPVTKVFTEKIGPLDGIFRKKSVHPELADLNAIWSTQTRKFGPRSFGGPKFP